MLWLRALSALVFAGLAAGPDTVRDDVRWTVP